MTCYVVIVVLSFYSMKSFAILRSIIFIISIILPLCFYEPFNIIAVIFIVLTLLFLMICTLVSAFPFFHYTSLISHILIIITNCDVRNLQTPFE